MKNEKIEKLQVHPLIADQEQSGESAIGFRGFVGTQDKVLRLYADLQMSAYIDIPKDAVVYVEKDLDGVTGQVRVFVSPDKKVTEVNKRTVPAHDSLFSASSAAIDLISTERLKLPRLRPRRPWAWCYEECEAVFAQQAADVGKMKMRAAMIAGQRGVDSDQYKQAISQAIETENRAVGWLDTCVRECQVRYPLSRLDSGAAEDIVSRLTKKYLGQGI